MNTPIEYEEQVAVIVSLYKSHKVSMNEDAASEWLACNSFELIEAYLNDVGVFFNYTTTSINISVNTIYSDTQWIQQKLKMVRNHFKLGVTYVKANTNSNDRT